MQLGQGDRADRERRDLRGLWKRRRIEMVGRELRSVVYLVDSQITTLRNDVIQCLSDQLRWKI